MTFSEYISHCQNWVHQGLSEVLENTAPDNDRLKEAMAYSTMAGGKRVRPLLVHATCTALGGTSEKALAAACAVELIHTYSLIHDDLPAMDDDDLRRGNPTCHKAFDEATAILAGDALLTLAFEVLADNPLLTAEARLQQTLVLSRASGAQGMIEGQARDMQSTGLSLTLEELKTLHNRKTGALIKAACSLGALAAGASDEQRNIVEEYADAIGLAFQVQDDILDVTASTEVLGKNQGSDIEQGKNTYVSLLGLEEARAEAVRLRGRALAAISSLPSETDTGQLAALAHYIIDRSH